MNALGAAAAVAHPYLRQLHPAQSKGYLIYDSKKCAGCVTRMLVCSLVQPPLTCIRKGQMGLLCMHGQSTGQVKIRGMEAPVL